MRSAMLLAAAATLLTAPALAASPYMASMNDTACRGKKTCVLTFPASATMLTIQHVSCGLLTVGETGEVTSVVLSTMGTAAGTPGDQLPIGADVSGKNIEDTLSVTTLFYVAPNDQPIITIASATNISTATAGGCLISGTAS